MFHTMSKNDLDERDRALALHGLIGAEDHLQHRRAFFVRVHRALALGNTVSEVLELGSKVVALAQLHRGRLPANWLVENGAATAKQLSLLAKDLELPGTFWPFPSPARQDLAHRAVRE